MHVSALVAPTAVDIMPGLQWMQLSTLLPPMVERYVPKGHNVQDGATAKLNDPAAQGKQVPEEVAFTARDDVPALQLEQLVDPGLVL